MMMPFYYYKLLRMNIYKNTVVYLIGKPGVGKKTIGLELAKHPNFRMIDGHMINNLVFPFVRVDGKTTLPEKIWDAAHDIRKIAMETMVDIGNRDFSYIFTNYLIHDNEDETEFYKWMESYFEKLEGTYVPVRILCETSEHKKRISTEDRDLGMKATCPDLVDEISAYETMMTGHPNELTLDVTGLTPRDAAQNILNHIEKISA